MKTQIIFLCVLGAIALVSCAPHSYSNQPPITLEEINALRPRVACVLDKGPCDELGMMAKQILPEVLKTQNCSKCDHEMNQRIQRIFYVMHVEFREELEQLRVKYAQGQSAHTFN